MITKLEMLIALAQERHFGRAAERLGITQPSLSSGIKQLEEQLGVTLVQRGARFGGMTPEGERALAFARQIVGDARQLKEEMRLSRKGLSGRIRMGVIPTASTWASRLATSMSEAHPGVGFSIVTDTSQEILVMIENLEIDAGITYLDNEPLGRVTKLPLYREGYSLVCRADHPCARQDTIGWAALADLKLCLLGPDMQNRRIINRNLIEAGVSGTTPMEANSTVVLVSHVLNANWVTILPGELAGFMTANPALTTVPITGGIQNHAVGLVTQYRDPQTPLLSALSTVARRLAE